MPWQICFELPPPIGRVCIDIPLLVQRWDKIPPWISENVLDASTIKDLPILATMNELASDLSNASLRKSVQAALQGGVKQPDVKGVTLNFKARKG